MAVNPFGDRAHEIDTALVAEHMGVTRRTVQRVVKKLESLDLIEVEVSKFKYKKRQQDRQATAGSPKRQQDRPSDSRIAQATVGSPKRRQDRQRELEPLQEEDFIPPQTIQTYSDFKKTLSEDERERFFYFVKQQIKNFKEPIKDLEAWLASKNAAGQNRWEVYYKLYKPSHLSTDPNEDSPCVQNSDGSKPQKRLTLHEEIEQRKREMLAKQTVLPESEPGRQETLAKSEYNEETEVNQEEKPDV
jgi:hypothetical protein